MDIIAFKKKVFGITQSKFIQILMYSYNGSLTITPAS